MRERVQKKMSLCWEKEWMRRTATVYNMSIGEKCFRFSTDDDDESSNILSTIGFGVLMHVWHYGSLSDSTGSTLLDKIELNASKWKCVYHFNFHTAYTLFRKIPERKLNVMLSCCCFMIYDINNSTSQPLATYTHSFIHTQSRLFVRSLS